MDPLSVIAHHCELETACDRAGEVSQSHVGLYCLKATCIFNKTTPKGNATPADVGCVQSPRRADARAASAALGIMQCD
ncbi:MAG TPA: hypothetical protein VN757_04410 [Steroidobacteraceae bacterium]|nr:hypothetical protein [Steroidobacteraceae bacterium]